MGRIIIDTYEYGDPRIKEASERMNRLIQAAVVRRYLRIIREAAVVGRPGWLGSIGWPFPTWSVRRRVFDWAVDEADIPLDPEDHWHHADRQQFDLYLRPTGAMVRR